MLAIGYGVVLAIGYGVVFAIGYGVVLAIACTAQRCFVSINRLRCSSASSRWVFSSAFKCARTSSETPVLRLVVDWAVASELFSLLLFFVSWYDASAWIGMSAVTCLVAMAVAGGRTLDADCMKRKKRVCVRPSSNLISPSVRTSTLIQLRSTSAPDTPHDHAQCTHDYNRTISGNSPFTEVASVNEMVVFSIPADCQTVWVAVVNWHYMFVPNSDLSATKYKNSFGILGWSFHSQAEWFTYESYAHTSKPGVDELALVLFSSCAIFCCASRKAYQRKTVRNCHLLYAVSFSKCVLLDGRVDILYSFKRIFMQPHNTTPPSVFLEVQSSRYFFSDLFLITGKVALPGRVLETVHAASTSWLCYRVWNDVACPLFVFQ